MGDIKVTDSSGNQLYTIKTDGNDKVTDVTPGADAAKADIDVAQMRNLLMGVSLAADGEPWKLDKLLESLANTKTDAAGKVDKDATMDRLRALGKAVEELKASIEKEKAKGVPDQPKIAKMKGLLNIADAQLKGLFTQVKGFEGDLSQAQKNQLASLLANHPDLDNASTPSPGKLQTPSQTPQSGAPQQPQYPGAGKAQAPGTGLPGGGAFDLNKVLQSSMFQTMGLNSLDTLGKNQMDQKKMMMLFMYFAMMAMSGDIGAMTAFMQFITTIITKDKAMQNVNMANKLIELEDASRKATDELLNTPSYDPNNPQVGADFSKTMEKVKAGQGSIATSQKLIAQMMEEFAQVSEFLNNLQKSLLDVRGRILSRMSSFNA